MVSVVPTMTPNKDVYRSRDGAKRRKTASESVSPQADPLEPIEGSPEGDEHEDRARSNTHVKKSRNAATQAQRERDFREREREKEAERVEAAGRRRGRADRRRVDGMKSNHSSKYCGPLTYPLIQSLKPQRTCLGRPRIPGAPLLRRTPDLKCRLKCPPTLLLPPLHHTRRRLQRRKGGWVGTSIPKTGSRHKRRRRLPVLRIRMGATTLGT